MGMNLGRWEPEFVAISCSNKKSATGPEDSLMQLLENYCRKQQAYNPILLVLQNTALLGAKLGYDKLRSIRKVQNLLKYLHSLS